MRRSDITRGLGARLMLRGTPMLRLSGSLLVLGAVLVVVTTCRDDRGPAAPTEPTIRSATSVAAASGPVTLVGAGNIAKCGATGDDATAVLLDGIPGTVFAAGDAAYDNGTLTQYNSWHNPLFDSKDAPNTAVRPLWDVLYGAGVDVVVNAHYAFYERFAPQTPAGVADPAQGIREFIVGTGGAEVMSFGTIRANSQVRSSGSFGVLKLTLDDARYSWQFVPVAGKTFSDSGSTSCHGAPPTVSAGSDVNTNPGDTVQLAATISDPDPTDAPWAYTINWGDNTSTTGSTTTQTAPLTVPHVYSALGTYSARVSVTNSGGASDVDTAAVKVVAPNVLVGAGDIADCAKTGDSLTANLMDTIPGTVFAAGDNAYPNGASSDYKNCYNPTWGRFKSRTKPVPGNHDYLTAGAAGYFNYFGAAAGASGKGYYSYDLGA